MNPNPFEPLLLQIAQQAVSIHAKLGTAESCTGGLIAANCTELAGSSEWFECGLVTYSNQAKMALLGVQAASLEQYGAVSETVVQEMVVGLIKRNNLTTGVAVSGVAGPGGGSPLKPVGTVCIAWQHLGHSKCQTYYFSGNRNAIRQATVKTALEGLLDLMKQANEA
jgi:nicotinamide-nucleotide amidase